MKGNARILVPVDGSENSDRAVDVAVSLSESYGAALDILYVSYFDSDTDSEEEDSWLPMDLVAPTGQERRKALERASERIPEGIEASFHHCTGTPAEKIVEFSCKHDDEIIVVGGRGLGLVRGFILGSVSQKVMQEAMGSVVVVK